jgi:hypothetical protein
MTKEQVEELIASSMPERAAEHTFASIVFL